MYQFRVITFGQENWRDYVFLEEVRIGEFNLNSMNVSRISAPIVVQDERAADAWQAAYKALQDALWMEDQDWRAGSAQERAARAALARAIMKRLEEAGGATMGRFERLTAKMERLVKQAENNPGTWFSELSSKVCYANGTYYVDAYKLDRIFEFYAADPVVALLVDKVMKEVATDRPELRDTY